MLTQKQIRTLSSNLSSSLNSYHHSLAKKIEFTVYSDEIHFSAIVDGQEFTRVISVYAAEGKKMVGYVVTKNDGATYSWGSEAECSIADFVNSTNGLMPEIVDGMLHDIGL